MEAKALHLAMTLNGECTGISADVTNPDQMLARDTAAEPAIVPLPCASP